MKITVEQDEADVIHELSLLRISCEGIERTFRLDLNFSDVIDVSWNAHVLGLDFLVICACVYAVDKIVPRKTTPDRWTRTLDVRIPVRTLETWKGAADVLAEAVSFLTVGLIRFRRRQMKGGYDGTDGRGIEEAAAAA
jgi:hypothetical protein